MRIRRLLVAISLCASGVPAEASAFLAPPGEGEIITAATFSDSTQAFDAHGKLVPIAAYRKFELGTYIEYGLTDRITLIAQPTTDFVRQGPEQPSAPMAASSDLGARIGLLTFGSTVLSLQGLAHIPLAPSSSPSAGYFDQSRVPATDLRLALGHGFSLGAWPAFLDLEAGHQWEGDGLPQQWHADLTFGVHPDPRLLLMLASFLTIAGHSLTGCSLWTECWSWLKLQSSAVLAISRRWSIEIGFFATVAGENAGRELGPTTALWYRF